jgi:signal transduction histidine kinase
MAKKPSYEELLQKVKALEAEKCAWLKESGIGAGKAEFEAQKNEDSLGEADRLGGIINIEELQSIMDDFHSLTGMVTAILDMDGNVIEATGWQDICTKFHRIHPETARNCTESDLYLIKNIKPGEYIKYHCKNGLWDVVTPLYIGNKHLGNIYTGQFFYDDDLIDEQKFIQQAETYGFDKDSYLDAFHRIPRYSAKVINHLMSFLVKFTSYISNVSYVNLKLEKEIKERQKLQAQLAEANEELEHRVQERTRALEKTHAQLLHAEKHSAIGRLSASIAHEFNNPLHCIMVVLSGMETGTSLSGKEKKLVSVALKECQRMKDLIDSLRDFNRPTSGKAIQVEVHSILDELLMICDKDFRNRNITIQKKYADHLPAVSAVVDQIKQVFLNLFNNAADACEGGGDISVITERHGQSIVVCIEDSGSGISTANLPHIFEPFYTTKPASKGTGLGLSVSYGIVKKHGGRIDVESEPGKGSKFSVILPLKVPKE